MKYILYILTITLLSTTAMNAQEADCEEDQFGSKMNHSIGQSNFSDDYSLNDIYRFAYQDPYQNDWTVGPNPTYGEINIYGNLDNINSIELYSIIGEMLQWYEGFDVYQSIDLSDYPNGLYFIRIVSKANEVKTYKVIKR